MSVANPALGVSSSAAVRASSLVRPALLLVLVLAFALRCWHLTGQSLWSDEGISINRALLPVSEMLATMPVEHAPGYFLLLGGWLRLAGSTAVAGDFALRFFSLLPGVLGVALLYRLGADLARPLQAAAWLGVVAALLGAVNPTLHWYAQEGRMYTWLFAAMLLSTCALWRILRGGSHRHWVSIALYAVSTALCVYLHYYGALIPISHAIYVLVWGMATRRWRPVLDWLIAATVAFSLFVPWLPRALDIFGFSGWREGGVVSEIPVAFARAYLVGYLPAQAILLLLIFGAVAILGVVWWIVRRPESALLLLLLMAVPLAFVVALAMRNPDFHPRYTLYVSAPLLVFVAAGVVGANPDAWRQSESPQPRSIWTAIPLLVLTLLVAANLYAVWWQQTDSGLAKPDFKGAVERIHADLQDGDVILVDGPDPDLVVKHYYQGDRPVHDLRDLDGASGEQVDTRLREAVAGGERIWELLYFHDPAAVQVWTATQAFASAPSYHQGIRITLYGLETPDLDENRLDLAVGETFTLITATVQSSAQAGDLVRVRTDWFTKAQSPELRFGLRMIDETGMIVASDDYVPQNWFAPTNVWLVDAPARDQRALLIPPETPPGVYTLTLRLYDPASGAPVTTDLGDDIPLGRVEVQS